MISARRDLRGRRAIGGRRAAGDRRHEGVVEVESVVTGNGRRLVGESGAVERRVEPVAALVAREDAAGAIAAVGGRSEPDDEEPRPRIAEPGHGASPVDPLAEARDPLARHALAMRDQPRAQPAADDTALDAPERVTRR